jgi:hypothetical protein
MSAERERGVSFAPATPVGALLAAILLVLLVAVPAPRATAESDSPDAGPPSGLVIVIAPDNAGVVVPDGSLGVRVVATNLSSAPTPPGSAALTVAASTPITEIALGSWFAGDDADARLASVASSPIPPLEPGASATVELTAEAESAGFTGAWGARALEVTISGGGRVLGSSRSAVVWNPGGIPRPTSVVTAVPLTAPGFEGTFIPAADLAVLTAPGGLLVRTLDAIAGSAVTIGIDPRVIASIRVLGDTAPESAVEFLARLRAIPNDTFALAWADADPLITAQARGLPLPATEGAGRLGVSGLIVPLPGESPPPPGQEGTPESSPTPPAPTDPVTPLTVAELSEWEHDIAGVVWPREGTVTSEAVGIIGAAGASTVIVSSAQLEGRSSSVGRIGDVRVLRSDSALSRAARTAVAAGTEQEWLSAVARASALLAASSSDDPGQVRMITLSRERLGNSLRLVDLIAAIDAVPWAAPTPLTTMTMAAGPRVEIIDAALPEERLAEVGRLLDAEAADREFAAVAVEPTTLTDDRRLELLAALSLGWNGDAHDVAARFLAESEEMRSRVQIVEGSTITLLSDRTSLPVTVQNALDVPIRVFVRVDSSTGRLLVSDQRVEAIVEAGSQTRALVPVQSLTNGEVEISVSLRDSEGRLVGSPTMVLLNLQAGWETAAIIAMGALVGGLLIFGLSRDLRRRRERRLAERVDHVEG